MIHITKLYPKPDCSTFDAYGRVFSGQLNLGDRVRVLGEGYPYALFFIIAFLFPTRVCN